MFLEYMVSNHVTGKDGVNTSLYDLPSEVYILSIAAAGTITTTFRSKGAGFMLHYSLYN